MGGTNDREAGWAVIRTVTTERPKQRGGGEAGDERTNKQANARTSERGECEAGQPDGTSERANGGDEGGRGSTHGRPDRQNARNKQHTAEAGRWTA